ncbi:hypothetical protein [Microvirga sp. TS319]|uniref:hypothetical protein n=1 Tax=Microvirga sp. TS319 TaxID=3241165 RepID=UPI00351A090B
MLEDLVGPGVSMTVGLPFWSTLIGHVADKLHLDTSDFEDGALTSLTAPALEDVAWIRLRARPAAILRFHVTLESGGASGSRAIGLRVLTDKDRLPDEALEVFRSKLYNAAQESENDSGLQPR